MKIFGELSIVDETFMISDMNFMVSEKLCNNGVTYDKQDFLYLFFFYANLAQNIKTICLR